METGKKPPAVKRGRPKKGSKVEEVVPLHEFHEPTKMEKLQALYGQWFNCKRCYLGEIREQEDIVFADGNPDADVMIIGEAPGEEEMELNIPFVGASGKVLTKMLAMVSDDQGVVDYLNWFEGLGKKERDQRSEEFYAKMLEWRQKEFFITNIVGCRPPDNRLPTPPEVKACWERLYNLIYIVDPKLIITSGRTALEALMRKSVEITKNRGELFDVQIKGRLGKVTYPVVATLHPAYLLRRADWRDAQGDYWKTVKDLHKAMRIVDGLRKYHNGTPIPNRPRIA